MINYFVFKGKSSLDFGLFIKAERAPYSAPAARGEAQQVPGRNGDIFIPDGSYENLPIPYPCFFKGKPNLAESTDRLKAWLSSDSGHYHRLEDSFNPDYYRIAYYSGGITVTDSLNRIGEAELTFSAKPMKYSKLGEFPVTLQKTDTIYNPEAFKSLPYIQIIGSGDITLSIGGQAWNFKGVDEYIEIDSEMMNAFKGTSLQNSKMSGEEFPVLLPGVNNIVCTGNVSKIKVIPRWCTL